MMHGELLEAIQSMYEHVTTCVRTPEGITDTFPSEMGVKEGFPMS